MLRLHLFYCCSPVNFSKVHQRTSTSWIMFYIVVFIGVQAGWTATHSFKKCLDGGETWRVNWSSQTIWTINIWCVREHQVNVIVGGMIQKEWKQNLDAWKFIQTGGKKGYQDCCQGKTCQNVQICDSLILDQGSVMVTNLEKSSRCFTKTSAAFKPHVVQAGLSLLYCKTTKDWGRPEGSQAYLK